MRNCAEATVVAKSVAASFGDDANTAQDQPVGLSRIGVEQHGRSGRRPPRRLVPWKTAMAAPAGLVDVATNVVAGQRMAGWSRTMVPPSAR
ncbi:MAG: hypothetical protein U0746_08495 [Gemmataceae bacterium]